MRPYQVYAVEQMVRKIEDQTGNGYIWHTTGSGKTLTSFKAAEIAANQDNVYKVLFVVDRKDLDIQTKKEYDKFSSSASGVASVNSTRELVSKLQDNSSSKIIITTIQKLDRAINKINENSEVFDKKFILIFDECHRSQKGDMHSRINRAFKNNQKFGFTGTPIFSENSDSFYTTESVFGKCMHKYLIDDAINDGNVLTFDVDYKGLKEVYSEEELKYAYGTEDFIRLVARDVVSLHDKKTHKREFNAIFATNGIDRALKYYDYFSELNKVQLEQDENYKPLKITCVFSVTDNEEGHSEENKVVHKDAMANIIEDYNEMFKDDKDKPHFNGYDADQRNRFIRNVAEKVKRNEIDILIVSDMFLTGFDAKCLNTFYYDKNLKMHNLIQAFSRTNRVSNKANKRLGNIVSYINNKEDVDEAVELFSSGGTIPSLPKYYDFLISLNDNLNTLKENYPTAQDVNDLKGNKAKLEFAKLYRQILRDRKIIETFREFTYDDLQITKQEFEDYSSAYFAIKIEPTGDDEKDETEPFDFEIELIRSDRITYDYIQGIGMRFST